MRGVKYEGVSLFLKLNFFCVVREMYMATVSLLL